MRLYKYVMPERVDILRHARIRFSQPTVFNDPFEMSPVFTGAGGLEHLGQSEEIVGKAREAFDTLPEETRQEIPFEKFLEAFIEQLNQTLIDQGAIDELLNVLLPQFYSETGVLSLTEKPDNLLMWAHYADHHRGFVIEFDGEHPFFNQGQRDDDEFHFVRKVQYAAARPVTTVAGFLGPQSLLTKSTEWEYEQEWRMLAYFPKFDHEGLQIGAEEVKLVSLPPTCITGIILGYRMPEEKRQEIIDLITGDRRYAHVRVLQAELDPERFFLNFRGLGEHYYERGKKNLERATRWGAGQDDEQHRETWSQLLQDALPDFSRANQLAPNETTYLASRAAAYQMLGNISEAIQDYSRVITLNPREGLYYALRGDLFARLGELERAEKDLDRAVALGVEGVEDYLNAIREARASQ